MPKVAFLIPGDLDLPTGGYRYDREVLARLQAQGISVQHVPLGASFPAPTAEELEDARRSISHHAAHGPVIVDGLALGAMPTALVEGHEDRLIALVHHPLGLESGLAPDRSAFLLENERRVLAHAAHVIVTSKETARLLVADFAVPAARVTIAEPGVARADRATGGGEVLQLLAVGAISHRKAYHLLVEALAPLQDLSWQLTIAGAADRASEAAHLLKDAINQSGLGGRVTITGAVSEETLKAFYASADLFVMSSLFEGYGMALTEALVRGIPIVTSTGGAAGETVPDQAALKVPPGDVPATSEALRKMLGDPSLRRRMADAAWAAGGLLPTWDDTAAEIAGVVRQVAGQMRERIDG